jgi:hypothetical protein
VSLARRNVFYEESLSVSVNSFDLRECEDCGDVIQQYPVLAGTLTVIIGAIVYAGISVLTAGAPDPVEITMFAVIFGVTYTGVNYAYRGQTGPEGTGQS